MSTREVTALEAAAIERMLADPQLAPIRHSLDPSLALVVDDRSLSGVGFMTSFVLSTASKLFGDGVSIRWGETLGRLHSTVNLDFVVYVDNGYLTALKGVTFGGESWPSIVTEFELIEITDERYES